MNPGSAPVPVGALRPAAGAPRRTELWLLVGAMIVVVGYAAAVEVGAANTLAASWWLLPAGMGGAGLVAHTAVWWRARLADPLLLPCATLVNGIGVVFLHRLDLGSVSAARRGRYPPLIGLGARQLLWTLGAVVCFVLVLAVVRDHQAITHYAYTLGLAGTILVIVPVLLPARYSEVNGSKLWIRIGGFSVQPGEFAKLALMAFFASYLINKRDVLTLASRRILGLYLPRGRDLGPVLAVWAVSMLVLAAQKDLGMALMYFGMFIAMLYLATARPSWILIALLLRISHNTHNTRDASPPLQHLAHDTTAVVRQTTRPIPQPVHRCQP